MRSPYRKTNRRRILSLGVLAIAVSLVSVQAAGGAWPRVGSRLKATSAPGVNPIWATQDVLDAAAADAKAAAGTAYYTDARVNDAADTVDLYLANAPQSIIDQIQALHPGTYVIHNDAAHPLSEMLRIQQSLPLGVGSLQTAAGKLDMITSYVTPDGYLDVGLTTTSTSDLQAAQSALDSLVGSGFIRVHGGEQIGWTGYRDNDPGKWNAGDFVVATGIDRYDHDSEFEDCSSGIGVHKSGDTSTTYMITAAHCAYLFGSGSPGIGVAFKNGYYNDLGSITGSGTTIGTVSQISNDTGGTSDDVALIGPLSNATGYDSFTGPWDGYDYNSVASTMSNTEGDYVFTSGAVTGQVPTGANPTIQIQNTSYSGSICVYGSGGTDCVTVPSISAWDPNNANAVATADGDSGGPVYSLDGNGLLRAHGMMDGFIGTSVTCPSDMPTNYGTTGCYHKLFFVAMTKIAADFNVATNIIGG